MTIQEIDPIKDPRWAALLERHPRATIFHTPAWLEVLRRTYGYEPFALTTATSGEDLKNGLVACRVRSWLTGSRTVSLPFSDHCEPLVETEEEFGCLLSNLKAGLYVSRAKYLEVRRIMPLAGSSIDFEKVDGFCLHRLDLRSSVEELFRGFHRDCIQRKIQRAERETLNYEDGRSESLLTRFYRLLVQTRRRQQLPPQPPAWFRNLMEQMGDQLKIRLVSKDAEPVASILTLRYKDTLVYKYGCSDRKFSKLGGTHLLLWKAIQEAKSAGLTSFDLGRSDWDNHGLIAFKDRWGASRSVVSCLRYGPHSARRRLTSDWQTRLARRLFGHTPNALLPLTGSLLYRHLA
jgi:CelD/BcsL family acetyltransferase involved in cellulose biosynthesis